MKSLRVIYWIVTGLFCLLMLGSAGFYLLKHDEVAKLFTQLNYPAYIVYPLAAAKILGVVAIVTKKSKALKEWAYAGFFFDLILAASAHYFAGVPSPLAALAGLVLLIASYSLDRKIYG